MNGSRRLRRARPPIDDARLRELALAYVGRFATTRAKLRSYLARKVRERGWAGAGEPDFDGLSQRLAEDGFIDDAGYAMSKARLLTGRGLGRRRVVEALKVAGVAEDDGAKAIEHSQRETLAAALRFAEKRRIGPFAAALPTDFAHKQKWIAAMVRAGHDFDVARTIVELEPGAEPDMEELADRLRLTAA